MAILVFLRYRFSVCSQSYSHVVADGSWLALRSRYKDVEFGACFGGGSRKIIKGWLYCAIYMGRLLEATPLLPHIAAVRTFALRGSDNLVQLSEEKLWFCDDAILPLASLPFQFDIGRSTGRRAGNAR